MSVPRLISLGYALPPYKATQEETLALLGFKSPWARKIFENAGIDQRYGWIAPEKIKRGLSWQELTDEYAEGARTLGVQAAREALDELRRDTIGSITFCSVTGYTCPSLSYAIAGDLGLRRDVVHANLLGQGCEAAVPSLERAVDHVLLHRDMALVVSAEICSATWFPVKSERDLDYMISAAIFGDAASAAVVGLSSDLRFPEIVDFESFFDPALIDLLGYKWEDGRLKVVLSRDVPRVVPPALRQTVDLLLARHALKRSDIRHWILHPGGRDVLENIERELGLSKEQTKWSWEAMKRVGNVSSATLGIIAKLLQDNEPPSPHEPAWGIAASMGAGTAVNAMLVRWG